MNLEFLTRMGLQSRGESSKDVLRAGRDGSLMCSDSLPPLYELARIGRLFSVTNQAAQAVSVALNTTYTGLGIQNPVGSGRNAVLLGVQYSLTVAPAGIASLHLINGLATAVLAGMTQITGPGIQPALFGQPGDGGGVKCKAFSAATLVTPGYWASLQSGFTAAALYPQTGGLWDLKGAFWIPPGGYACIGALTAVTGFGTLLFAELDA